MTVTQILQNAFVMLGSTIWPARFRYDSPVIIDATVRKQELIFPRDTSNHLSSPAAV